MIEERTRHENGLRETISSANKKSLVIYRELVAFWYGDVVVEWKKKTFPRSCRNPSHGSALQSAVERSEIVAAIKLARVMTFKLSVLHFMSSTRFLPHPERDSVFFPSLARPPFFVLLIAARECRVLQFNKMPKHHVDELLLFSSPESFFNCDNEEDFRTSLVPEMNLSSHLVVHLARLFSLHLRR
jgi:hypothetical protein